LTGPEPLLHFLGGWLRNPRSPVGFIETSRILPRIDLSLESRNAARPFLFDPEIKPAVALDREIFHPNREVAINLVRHQVSKLLFRSGMYPVNRALLYFPIAFPN